MNLLISMFTSAEAYPFIESMHFANNLYILYTVNLERVTITEVGFNVDMFDKNVNARIKTFLRQDRCSQFFFPIKKTSYLPSKNSRR